MATLAQQSSLSFGGYTYTVTAISVESATPEIVDMTSVSDSVGTLRMVNTGAFTAPGKISVEGFGPSRPASGASGTVDVNLGGSSSFSATAVCESSAAEARVGDVLRIRFSLILT